MLSVEGSQQHQGEQLDNEVCWALLERVAGSVYLRRAARLRGLLLYVGQRSLKDGCDHIPEQEIGVKVFGRPDTYDNANDSIVRTTISDLRKRIDTYFAEEGRDEPIVMEIPRGSYIPIFRQKESQPVSPDALSLSSAPEGFPRDKPNRPVVVFDLYFRWGAAAATLMLTIACIVLLWQNRSVQRSAHPWKYEPAVSSLWSGLLDSDRDTDVVMEDSSALLVQLIRKQNISLSDYINKSYLGTPSIQGDNPEIYSDLLLISRKALGKASDFRLSLGIRALDPQNSRLRFYNAREYTPQLLQKDNVILMGNPTSNPWNQWFENSLNFAELPETRGSSVVINRAPKAGESASYYKQGDAVAYCAIAYLPKPDHSGNMLIIQGTSSEATEAGGEFLISEKSLADFANSLHVQKLPYFEAVLDVSQVLGSAVTKRVVAYRTYPNLHE
jgi:hypothetical protein